MMQKNKDNINGLLLLKRYKNPMLHVMNKDEKLNLLKYKKHKVKGK